MSLTPNENADFQPTIEPSELSPSMGNYNSPKTFRFWCQKVLPLVYDNSLSYYELLCKVVDYLNKTMEDVNTAVQDVTELHNDFGSLQTYVNTNFAALNTAYGQLQSYVNDYFTNLDVQEEINNKLDEMAEDGTLDAIIDNYFDNGVKVTFHNFSDVGDTSWVCIKMPRNKYKLEFHNCSGDDTNSPTTLVSNPLEYLKNHLEADIATNCNFGGLAYPGRLNGTNYSGSVFTRRLFCYDSTNDEINITAKGVSITNVPSEYDTVFAIGDLLVSNGEAATFTELEQNEPRNIFGWNNTHYIILICEGRGTGEKGLTLTECQEKMIAFGAINAVNFDGGGSVCLAANIGDNAKKINKYRDYAKEFPTLRKVGLCAVYTRR